MTRFLTGLLAITLLGPIAASPSVQAQTPATQKLEMDPAVRVGTLPNGLKYYIRQNGWPVNRAELRLAINAGSILEDESQRGLAHFLEHMAFNGTKSYPENKLISYFQSIGMGFGADVNAYTSFDETVYKLTVPTDSARRFLNTGLHVLQEWASEVTFDSTEFEKERGVVMEEWRGRRGVQARLFDQQSSLVFAGTKYAERLPIGLTEVLQHAPVTEAKRFYNDWYRPDLMAVVVVGDINVDSVEMTIKELFGPLKARTANPPERTSITLPGNKEPQVKVMTDPELTGRSVSVLIRHPAMPTFTVGDRRRDLLLSMYASMLNSRYSEISIKPDAPFTAAQTGMGSLTRSASAYQINVTPKPGKFTEGVEAAVTEIERVRKFGFTASEFERLKVNMLQNLENAWQRRDKIRSVQYADSYVGSFLGGEPAISLEANKKLTEELLPTIKVEEINALATSLITDTNRVVLAAVPPSDTVSTPKPEGLIAAFEAGLKAPVVAYSEAIADAPLLDPLPKPGKIVSEVRDSATGIYTWTLSNGLKVYFKQTNFQPDNISISGSRYGGTSKIGDVEALFRVNSASQIIQAGGLKDMDAVTLRKRLAGKSAGYGVTISGMSEGIGAGGTKRDFEVGLQLLTLAVTQPRKDSSIFKTAIENSKTQLQNRGKSPEIVFGDTIGQTMSMYSPRSPIPTPELFDKINLDTAFEFYKKTFADFGEYKFIAIGDISPDSMKPLVERYIASLPAKTKGHKWVNRREGPPPGVVKKAVYAGQEPKSTSLIRFTGKHPVARESGAQLGAVTGILQIRLTEVLREKLGGTYSPQVGGGISRIPEESYQVDFVFGAEPERLVELQNVVFEEIRKLQNEGPTEEEMLKIKERAARGFEQALRSNQFWANSMESYAERGYPFAEILQANRFTQNLTAEDVKKAAKIYLNEAQYAMFSLYPESMDPKKVAKVGGGE